MMGEHHHTQTLLSILKQGNEGWGWQWRGRNHAPEIQSEDWYNRKVTFDMFLLLNSCLASLITS